MKAMKLFKVIGIEKAMRDVFVAQGGDPEEVDVYLALCMPEFIEMFSELYTEEEIDALIAFHKSPVGQKSLSLAPQIAQRSFEIGQRAAMKHFQQQILAETHQLRSTFN